MSPATHKKTAARSLEGLSVILDRDGTVIEDRHYLSDPAGILLLPGALEALGLLHGLGARLFIATNQSGIGRG